MRNYLYCIFLLFVIPAAVIAQSKKINKDKIPTWVTERNIDYNNTSLDKDAEDGYIDIDYERQVNVGIQSVYQRIARRTISESGIENVSQVSVSYDPLYQSITFHTLFIIRDGKKIDKLNLSKFKVVQQEEDLDENIYNGELSAVMILDDVRKGDVIEYSYTRKGFNPVFRGKFSDDFYTAFAYPVCNVYYKLVAPQNRTINFKNFGTDIKPLFGKNSSNNVYEWSSINVNAIHEEDNTPGWYESYPEIMLSEFSSWKEVNDWALSLFADSITIAPSLQKKIDEITAANKSTEERILAALHFVQDEVRYMGIEIGSNSHKPNDPNKIFTNRYGDCKDKAYLLCTMLNKMGVEAKPVLINTYYKKALYDWLPSPYDFDHVTVCVKYNNHTYFFDATIAYQRGSLENISYPNYQCGLVISDTTTALTAITLQEKGAVTTKETFDVNDMGGKAIFKVVTKYTGSYADDQRYSYHSNSLYEIQKSFLKFYKSYYDNITVADSVVFNDDSVTGTITTTEKYNIDDLWELKKGVKKAHFESFMINTVVKKASDKKRKMPFRIIYPAEYYEDVLINLPEKWDIEKDTHNINTAAFSLTTNFSSAGKQVTLQYHYKALKDNVMPDELQDFMDGYNDFTDNLAYNLTYDTNIAGSKIDRGQKQSHGGAIFLSVLAVTVIIIFIIRRSQV